MHDVEKIKLKRKALINLDDFELQEKARSMHEPMTCEDRLAHAIQVDKLKIYPDGSMVVEKMQSRKVAESHHDRVSLKFQNNQNFGD